MCMCADCQKDETIREAKERVITVAQEWRWAPDSKRADLRDAVIALNKLLDVGISP